MEFLVWNKKKRVLHFVLGEVSYSNRKGRFSGRQTNDEPILSSSNVMSVRFRTDMSVTRPGFQAVFKAGKEYSEGLDPWVWVMDPYLVKVN